MLANSKHEEEEEEEDKEKTMRINLTKEGRETMRRVEREVFAA